ncbi:nuclear transport factor 2 family protein [Marivirga sp. S37H4]|uniref:Nuclear transport factor 2 family protein n=1 Tax=Marivirga aurantiaca TaxID=2802615 RepID=A0A934WZE2_9BACT|nr:DUF4440 domain-containing protein [Marivirga aurantiaca]MBK6265657.1 nuclear transport factor 2 family protein [Marivirga aurantiaca]
MKTYVNFQPLLVILLFFLNTISVNAQTNSKDSQSIYDELAIKDSLMFKIGFDQCDLTMVKSLINEDFEFYHDIGGIDSSREDFINTMRRNLCPNGENAIRRELVQGSLKVFPLYDNGVLYGAIQTGSHRFPQADSHTSENNSAAQFMHLWLLKNGEWKISRVLSFDHQ